MQIKRISTRKVYIMSTLWLKLPLNIIDYRALWPNGGVLESQKLILIRDSCDFNPPEISNSLSLCGIMKLLSRDKSEPANRPLPSSKTLTFKMRPRGQPLFFLITEVNTETRITTHLEYKTGQSLAVNLSNLVLRFIYLTKPVACILPSSINKGWELLL